MQGERTQPWRRQPVATKKELAQTWQAERIKDEAGERERQQRLPARLEFPVSQLLGAVADDAQFGAAERDALQQRRQLRLLVRQLHLQQGSSDKTSKFPRFVPPCECRT